MVEEQNIYVDQDGETAPPDAQYFDKFWKQFLKTSGGELYVWVSPKWYLRQHKDGVNRFWMLY